MAQPMYYPDWATEDTNLPGTGKTNKVRPKETIRLYGMDFGQIMTAEELNWWFNNVGAWIHYLVDDVLPTLPDTYLPLRGTKITLSGDASGSVTWNGDKSVNLNVTVADNSHKHLSADITDATTNTPAPNVLVKRGTGGEIYAADIVSCATSATDSATFFMKSFDNKTIGNISSYTAAGGALSISRINPTTGAGITLMLSDEGYTTLTNPRSNNAQETGNPGALVRLDYLNGRLNIVENAVVRDIRIGNEVYIDVRTNSGIRFPAGNVQVGLHSNYNDGNWELDHVYYAPIQKNVNGVWYTVGSL